MSGSSALDQQKLTTFFYLSPETKCEEATVTVGLYKPTRDALDQILVTTDFSEGDKAFAVHYVWATRGGLALFVRDRAGDQWACWLQDPDWERAWDVLGYGSSERDGPAALETLAIIQDRISKGGLRRRGEHGARIKGGRDDMEKGELFIATILAGDLAQQRRQASVRVALSMSVELLPKTFRHRLEAVRTNFGEKGRKVELRELEKDAAKKVRDAEKAARSKPRKA